MGWQENPHMRIAAMAAGAIGGYFAARLAAAGHEVPFIARGAHRDAIAKNGLTIKSALGDLHLSKANVTDDPAKVGPVDIVLFAVKLWDTEKAAEQARPLVAENTRVITLQNGVDSVERIAPVLGVDQTIGGSRRASCGAPQEPTSATWSATEISQHSCLDCFLPHEGKHPRGSLCASMSSPQSSGRHPRRYRHADPLRPLPSHPRLERVRLRWGR
jgi:ketopantoate reductase